MGKYIITTAGKKLQAKVFAGSTKFNFTKIGVGDGFANGNSDYENRTALFSPKIDVSINKTQLNSNNICKVIGVLENTGLTEALYVREVGLFAKDPDDGEILFCARYYDRPTVIEEESAGSYTKEFDFDIGVESADNVTITVNKAGMATLEDLEDSAADTKEKSISGMTELYKSALIALLPAHYGRSVPLAGAKTTITLPDYMTVNIGNNGFVHNGSETIDITQAANWDDATLATAANRKGKDFYVYACQPTDGTTVPKIILSANSTVPTGYTATNSRKIGGFHGECADVGTISGHPLSGYAAGDILPASVWDLRNRPVASPEGMVFDGRRWIDIYIASWDGSKLVSRFGGVMADGESSPKWHGEKFEEYFAEVGKHLLSRSDFMHCMKGIQEQVNIKGSADANTTGGHVNTNNVRIISNYGVEDCAGVIWQWGSDLFEAMSTSHSGSNTWNDGYSWSTLSVYNGDIDETGRGSCFGFLRRVLFGGGWGDGAYCGSRSADCSSFSSRRDGSLAGRGCSEPLAVSL